MSKSTTFTLGNRQTRSYFAVTGEQVVFRQGLFTTDDQVLIDDLKKNAKAIGCREQTQEDIDARKAEDELAAKAAQRTATSQGLVNAILAGDETQLATAAEAAQKVQEAVLQQNASAVSQASQVTKAQQMLQAAQAQKAAQQAK